MRKIILLITLAALSMVGCEESISVLLINKTKSSILYLSGDRQYPGSPYQGSIFPDTTLQTIKPVLIEIEPDRSRWLTGGVKFSDDLETEYREMLSLPKDTLSIYIFDPDTVAKYSWEEIRDGYKIIVRYDYSISEIARLNGRITYPR